MSLILCIATGLALGGLLSVPTAHDRSELAMNLMTGMSGAVLGGWLLGPIFDSTPAAMQAFDQGNLLSAIGGAVILLAIVHVLHAHDTVE